MLLLSSIFYFFYHFILFFLPLCLSSFFHYVSLNFFVFKQKTAYELRISDWSSDVCSSDLQHRIDRRIEGHPGTSRGIPGDAAAHPDDSPHVDFYRGIDGHVARQFDHQTAGGRIEDADLILALLPKLAKPSRQQHALARLVATGARQSTDMTTCQYCAHS